MSAAVVLRAEDLHRSYGHGAARVRAVRGVSLELRAGELVVLRGPSGSGKTTLLNLLGGLDRPSRGDVRLDGRSVVSASRGEQVAFRRQDLGFVFQASALLDELTASENVDLVLRLGGLDRASRNERSSAVLEAVGLSAHAAQRPPELSGGQRQRLDIARALAHRPRVLIADEPTGRLDSANAEAIMRMLVQLVRGDRIAAIVSTHDPRMAAHADRIVEMRDGFLAGD
ncbi:putative ABC transport system ATP-binding protein [Microbacterium sp. AK009]|uniref:ABC transporter ATP-binding protein n=1 Tax=Microbacterium sp. AK009 TaxID=2723068 RepID=UPI0015C89851|nr:ABC transporter ATP-binding protein [Microbacterium sp. AK009]NYF16674.1 putative ABC transport system ATP-binding protein [Microbacterium sp. AK009]